MPHLQKPLSAPVRGLASTLRATPPLPALVLIGALLSNCSANPATELADELPLAYYRSLLEPHLGRRFNERVAFFVDLTRPSNQTRFFVLDLKTNQVLAQGLCCNGRTNAAGEVVYSNTPNSNCSSKGAAKVSYAYNGQFGKAYKLEGLETSNSNVFARAVVLHAHSCVPAEPTSYPICESQGCPTVNPAFLATLAGYIDHSPKPILLYVR
ncbi:murein L,D-transpeptidase catalytic domain-containing protein [Hymenobacter latericus]|uniref:murein L,D-transpeptidase catalytic domain-containing protein n=1 Tax=Hymenobacter sp. YIM 151858-1 TaxID=2987688 RepID=UPI002225F1E1|nr:murein L,D-transpeptidase catalytic domain family protein [Hymenobacter sp. YIM 151858-1]UYZ58442.1 murein L,D-transpeptidase catalytic domain family protein [Hymenobacter sp. YIM 151858-1]